MRIDLGVLAVGALVATSLVGLTGCDDKKPDAKPNTASATGATATAHATAASATSPAPAKTAAPGGGW